MSKSSGHGNKRSAGAANGTAAERKARLEEMKAQQKRAQRRRTILVSAVAGGLCLALIVGAGVVIFRENQRNNELAALASQPIEGVQTFDGLTAYHVTTPVAYPQSPAVGGDHDAVWLNCGIYTEPVPEMNAVHSLEHGAVWITHSEDLPADQLATLTALAERNNYVILSPYPGQETPVAASAWGAQLTLDDADDERLPVFLRAYQQGPQTPEPGAACWGGVGA